MQEPELPVILTSLPPYLLSGTEALERDYVGANTACFGRESPDETSPPRWLKNNRARRFSIVFVTVLCAILSDAQIADWLLWL